MQTVSEKLKEMQKVLQPSPLSPTVDGRAQMSLLDIPFQMCCPVHRMLGAFFFSPVIPSVTLAAISSARAIKCPCISHAPSFPGHHTVSV